MTQVVILAGGLGTRLGEKTAHKPKCLVEILGSPFIAIQLNLLRANGVKKVLVCIGHLGEMVQKYLSGRNFAPMQIEFSVDPSPKVGTMGALAHARDLLDERFFVTYGDSFLNVDYQDIFEKFMKSDSDILMTYTQYVGIADSPNVQQMQTPYIKYQKNTADNHNFRYTDFGLLGMKLDVLPTLSQYGNDLSLALEKYSSNHLLEGLEVLERYFEIGSEAGIQKLETHLKERSSELHQ